MIVFKKSISLDFGAKNLWELVLKSKFLYNHDKQKWKYHSSTANWALYYVIHFKIIKSKIFALLFHSSLKLIFNILRYSKFTVLDCKTIKIIVVSKFTRVCDFPLLSFKVIKSHCQTENKFSEHTVNSIHNTLLTNLSANIKNY